MDIMEMIKKYKLQEEGADVDNFIKEFRSTYKHSKELDSLREKIKTLEGQNQELIEKSKNFDGKDIEKYKQEIEELKAKQSQELDNQKIKNLALKELYQNKIKNIDVGLKLLSLEGVDVKNFEKEIPERIKALVEDESTSFAFNVQKSEPQPNMKGIKPTDNQDSKNNNTKVSIGAELAKSYCSKFSKGEK